jgi:hypothetical protein
VSARTEGTVTKPAQPSPAQPSPVQLDLGQIEAGPRLSPRGARWGVSDAGRREHCGQVPKSKGTAQADAERERQARLSLEQRVRELEAKLSR